jgi:hypothetical protein
MVKLVHGNPPLALNRYPLAGLPLQHNPSHADAAKRLGDYRFTAIKVVSGPAATAQLPKPAWNHKSPFRAQN